MKMFKKFAQTAFAAALLFGASEASAVPVVGLTVEGAGIAQIYQLTNGNLLGLVGIENRVSQGGSATAQTITGIGDLTSTISSGAGNVVGFYNGSSPVNPGASEFDPLAYDFTVGGDVKLFDALWMEWTGGNVVFNTLKGGTTTMGTTVTRTGDPLSVIPVPAGALLIFSAFGVAAAVRRLARSSAAPVAA